MGWHGNSWGRGAWHSRDGDWAQPPWHQWHGDRDAGKGYGKAMGKGYEKGDGKGYGRDRDGMSLSAALGVVRRQHRRARDARSPRERDAERAPRHDLPPFDGPQGREAFHEGRGAAHGAPWHAGPASWQERPPPWHERQASWLALGSAAVTAIGSALAAIMPTRGEKKEDEEPQTLPQRVGAMLAARPRTPPRALRGQDGPKIEDISEVESLRAEIARMREQLAQTQRADVAPPAKQNRRDTTNAEDSPSSPAYVSRMVREALEQHLAADMSSARRQPKSASSAAARTAMEDLEGDEEEDFVKRLDEDDAQPDRKRKRPAEDDEQRASGTGLPPTMRIRIGATRPSTIPDIITPEAHKAFMAWLGAKGSIRGPMAVDIWACNTAKRWSIATWTQKLKAKGMRRVPETREPLMEAALRMFVKETPEFAPPRPPSA